MFKHYQLRIFGTFHIILGFIVGWYFDKFIMGGVHIITLTTMFVQGIDIIFIDIRSRKHYSEIEDKETLKNMKRINYFNLLKDFLFRRLLLLGGLSILVYYLTVKIL